MKLILKRTTNNNVDFKKLILELDDDLHVRYNNMQYQYNAYTKIDFIDTVIVAYMDNTPVGCCCFKQIDKTTVEIKRTFVYPYFRGLGLASSLLKELIVWAKELKYTNAVLEIGKKQEEAYKFYTKYDFSTIDNFAPYIGSKNSICLGREL